MDNISEVLVDDENGRPYYWKTVPKYFVNKNGEAKEYPSKIKMYLDKLKAGRKKSPFKKKAKSLISKLNDKQCERLLVLLENLARSPDDDTESLVSDFETDTESCCSTDTLSTIENEIEE